MQWRAVPWSALAFAAHSGSVRCQSRFISARISPFLQFSFHLIRSVIPVNPGALHTAQTDTFAVSSSAVSWRWAAFAVALSLYRCAPSRQA